MTRRFLESLRFYDRDNIPEQKVRILKKIVAKNMKFEGLEYGSKAVRPLCTWINALLAYHSVMKIVEPLKAKHKLAEQTLANVSKKKCLSISRHCGAWFCRPKRLLLPYKKTCLRQRRL